MIWVTYTPNKYTVNFYFILKFLSGPFHVISTFEFKWVFGRVTTIIIEININGFEP